MSINTLFSQNDTILFCDTMHCKKINPPMPGLQGDIYTVNAANETVFSKTFEGNEENYRFKNCGLFVVRTHDNGTAILGVGVDSSTTNTQAVFGLGEEDTNNSWIYLYDPVSKDLLLGQNAGCTNKNFSMNLGTGNFGLTAQNVNMSTDDISFGKNGDTLTSFKVYADLNETNGSNLVHNDSNITIGGNNCVVTAPIKFENQIRDATDSAGLASQYLATDGTQVLWTNTSMYREKIFSNGSTFTAALDNIYIAPNGNITLPNTGFGDAGRRLLLATANFGSMNVIFPVGHFLMNTNQSNFTINTTNGSIELICVTGNQWVAIAIGGDWNGLASTGFISLAYYDTPGGYNVTVPTGSKRALITAVGAGGGGSNPTAAEGGGGGGAGGAIVDFPVGVKAGQTIAISVGQGGGVSTAGGDTTINMGTFTITCTGGGGGLSANPTGNGGAGGSVILPTGTIAGGAAGSSSVGGDGNIGFFVYSGAGGGSGTGPAGTSYAGGNNLLSTGGVPVINGGGGGASAFANGGVIGVSNGSLGSGASSNVNGFFIGGNGFVSITFES